MEETIMPIAAAGEPYQAAISMSFAAAAAAAFFSSFLSLSLRRVPRRARPLEEMPVRHEVVDVCGCSGRED
jgi:hypothetical protein